MKEEIAKKRWRKRCDGDELVTENALAGWLMALRYATARPELAVSLPKLSLSMSLRSRATPVHDFFLA